MDSKEDIVAEGAAIVSSSLFGVGTMSSRT